MFKMFQNITVLLAEDEETLATSMKMAIGEYFHQFIVVHNGEEALKAYYKYSPDIIITDILMPKLTGLELMQQLREAHKDIPIIILSAHSDSDKLIQAIDFGVTKYFVKPFDPDELLAYMLTLIPKIKKLNIITLIDGFNFNLQTEKLYHYHDVIPLTKREKILIVFLLKQKAYMADNEDIKSILWKEDVSNERLRTFIKRLRKKTSKTLIINSSGLGYGMVTSSQ